MMLSGCRAVCVLCFVVCEIGLRPLPLRAEESSEGRGAELVELLQRQSRQLEQQAQRLEDQERRLRAQESLLRAQLARRPRTVLLEDPHFHGAQWAKADAAELALRAGQDAGAAREDSPTLDANLVRRGGVLTSEGIAVLEPYVDWTTTRLSQFFFQGIEIVDAVLIGDIEASESERSALASGIGVRIGWSDRLEIEAQVPMVRSSDELTSRIVSQQVPATLRTRRRGAGLGDLELGLRYQLSEANGDDPIAIANLRFTLPTGKGPFDVGRDGRGFERELPTGSGHFSVEPSVTVILPSDPTVLFANLSYQLNVPFDADTALNTGSGVVRVGRVDPGDAIGVNAGMAIALNDRTSLRLGYDHQYVLASRTEIEGSGFDSESLHIGVLEVGVSHRTRRGMNLNLSVGIGVTDAAPDIRFSLRVPLSFELF